MPLSLTPVPPALTVLPLKGPAKVGRTGGPARLPRTDAELSSALRIVVARLGRRLRVERDADVLPAGLVAVLATLHRTGPIRISALAEEENVRPPSMTRTVATLADAGLVTRTANPADGRQVVVGLTEAGTRALEEDRRRRQAWFDVHLRALTRDDREKLRAALPVLQRIAGA